MNHVVWSGLAGGVGAAGAVLAAGARYSAPVALLMVAGAVGAMVMGQLLVGSSQRLSRPFGYFGSLAAIAVLGGAWVLASPGTRCCSPPSPSSPPGPRRSGASAASCRVAATVHPRRPGSW